MHRSDSISAQAADVRHPCSKPEQGSSMGILRVGDDFGCGVEAVA